MIGCRYCGGAFAGIREVNEHETSCRFVRIQYPALTDEDIYSLARGCRVFGDDGKLREPTKLEIALAQRIEKQE